MKGIYNFHIIRRHYKSTKWCRAKPYQFAIFGYYSTPDSLKLIELRVNKSNIGNISFNKTVLCLLLSKRKKGRHIIVAELSPSPNPPSVPVALCQVFECVLNASLEESIVNIHHISSMFIILLHYIKHSSSTPNMLPSLLLTSIIFCTTSTTFPHNTRPFFPMWRFTG